MIVRQNDRIKLRDFELQDIKKRVYWETVETEWKQWDAPWESDALSEQQKKAELDDYIERMHTWVKDRTEHVKRTALEIVLNDGSDRYIGWCNSYRIDEEGNFSRSGNRCAIGIDLPEQTVRGQGYGSAALMLFIDYLLSCGETALYTQTWSGNIRMLGLAEKLGFEEEQRDIDECVVNGTNYDGLTLRLNLEKFKMRKEELLLGEPEES